MNVRKTVDYSAMHVALDKLMAADLSQMRLYYEIGQLVGSRPEKGAAVAAVEYLRDSYPDVSGFSPRNLRRMREFYRTYTDSPKVLSEAMTVGWTQNVVIFEANLTHSEQVWYIQAVQKFGWSKLTLLEKIRSGAHTEIALDFQNEVCYTEENDTEMEYKGNDKDTFYMSRQYLKNFPQSLQFQGFPVSKRPLLHHYYTTLG